MALSSLFGGSASSAPAVSASTTSNSQVKEELKAQIGQELAVANATELVNKMTDNCFEQCLAAPYSSADEVCSILDVNQVSVLTLVPFLTSLVLTDVLKSI